MADHQYSASVGAAKTTKKSVGSECCAINCTNYQNPESRRQGISFHKFPNKEKHALLHQQWVRNCRRENWQPGPRAVICSKHFRDEMLDRTGQITRLREHAVPTVFNLPAHLVSTSVTRSTLNSSKPDEDVVKEPELEPSLMRASTTHLEEHNYVIGSPSKLKTQIASLRQRTEELQRINKNLRAREKRAKLTCASLIKEMRELNLTSAELEDKLNFFSNISVDLFHNSHDEYTPQQRSFALTLHLYSPKAYEFLRESLPLPSPRTLRRWLEHVDPSPGINTSMIEALMKKRQENPAAYTHCSFMLDAMAIRRQITFDSRSQSMVGYVDLGMGTEAEEQAKEALVFMVVGLRGGWKAPIAFYLTRVLSAETQSTLLKATLEKLGESGFIVHSLTMDGHSSNQSMCHLLGASMTTSNLQPFFHIPSNPAKIWILYDACHMLKLVRNTLEAYKTLETPNGTVQWTYVVKLHQLQQAIGLRFGNKLSERHLNFQQQKMKVSLAVQVISSSVAKALQTAQSLGFEDFAGCGATVKFLSQEDWILRFPG